MKSPDAVAPAPQRSGRPIDHSSDARILETTVDLLAERDYDGVTLDEVASRTGKAKSTLYRRWATKEDLVLAAVRSVGRPPEIDVLPETGSLRSDLLAVIDSVWLGGAERRLAIFLGLASTARGSLRLAPVVQSEVTEPYVEIYRRLLQRAVDRGEVSLAVTPRIWMLAEVIPALSSHRLSSGSGPVGRNYFVAVIDDVILAALGISVR